VWGADVKFLKWIATLVCVGLAISAGAGLRSLITPGSGLGEQANGLATCSPAVIIQEALL